MIQPNYSLDANRQTAPGTTNGPVASEEKSLPAGAKNWLARFGMQPL